jgi:hypothetical protein
LLQAGTAGQGGIQGDPNAQLVGDFPWPFGQAGRLKVVQGKIGAFQGILEGTCDFYLSTMNVCSVLGV